MATRQDRSTWTAYMKSIIATNGTKSITGANHQTVLDNLGESVIFYNEQQSKENVRVATTAAGTLASSFENGDTVDGVVLATGDRILIKDQASASENGVYTVNVSGAPTRATDFDTADEVILGSIFYVEEGTANAGKYFYLSAPTGTITLGSSNLTFTVLGASFDINGLSSFSGTIDLTNDYLPIYDASGATNLKIPMERVAPAYGTFTPGIAFGGGTAGITYSTQNGTYIETVLSDGKYRIDFNIYIVLTDRGSSTGNATITGLPRSANANFPCHIFWGDDGTSGGLTATTNTFGLINNAATTITLYSSSTSKIDSAQILAQGNFSTAGSDSLEIYANGFYISG